MADDRYDSAAIIVHSVAATLTTLVVAVGLLLGLLLAASPRLAYDLYEATGNARGVYVSAEKLAERADRRYGALGGGEREAYNIGTRLPAFRLAAERGVAYYGGRPPETVVARLRAVVTDGDFQAYARAADRANMARSSKGAHVYVTGEAGYLSNEYVRLIGPERAAGFVAERFDRWLDGIAAGVPAEILCEGGAVAYLEGLLAAGRTGADDALFAAFDAAAGDPARSGLYREETERVLPALHVAKSCTQLYLLFSRLDPARDVAAAAAAWRQTFSVLADRYAAD